MNYNSLGDITSVVDTLGRSITFNYDSSANLTSISQAWAGQTHVWASFGWDTKGIQPNFSGVALVGIANASTFAALTQVNFDDGTVYSFDYPGTGQFAQTGVVSTISRTIAGTPRAYTAYSLTNDTSDPTPRISSSRAWAENWSDINSVPHEVTTNYSVASDYSWGKITTAPYGSTYADGIIYKQFFATTGWQKRLPTESKVYLSNADEQNDHAEKRTITAWTQDDPNASYQSNPRVTETNVYDASSNRQRVAFKYTTPFNLPEGGTAVLVSDVFEYDADGATLPFMRRTHTDYNLSSTYLSLSRRLIGLTSATLVCGASASMTDCSELERFALKSYLSI